MRGRAPVFIRPSVAGLPLPAYKFTEARLAELEARLGRPLVRLQSNESYRAPPPRVAAAAAAAAAAANRYPCAASSELCGMLGARLGAPAARVAVTNGSEQAIRLIGEAFLDDTCVCVAPAPTFPVYSTALRASGCQVVSVGLDATGANDAEALGAAAAAAAAARGSAAGDDDAGARTVVVCSTVNNPTGGRMGAAALRTLRDTLPSSTLLVVDDAYAEFEAVGARAGEPDALAVLVEGDARVDGGGGGCHHWILLRTFAKAWGLAGLRVGYALASSEEVAGGLHRAKGVFQVNACAQAAAAAALREGDAWMYERVRHTVAMRATLLRRLRSLGLPTLPAHANFVCFDVWPASAAEVATRLAEERGVLVCPLGALRGADGLLLREAVRVTVGDEADIEALLEALPAVLALQPAR